MIMMKMKYHHHHHHHDLLDSLGLFIGRGICRLEHKYCPSTGQPDIHVDHNLHHPHHPHHHYHHYHQQDHNHCHYLIIITIHNYRHHHHDQQIQNQMRFCEMARLQITNTNTNTNLVHRFRSNVRAAVSIVGGGYDLVRWADCRLRPRLSGKKGSSKFQPRDSAANRLR